MIFFEVKATSQTSPFVASTVEPFIPYSPSIYNSIPALKSDCYLFFFILLKSLRLQARRRKKRAPAYYLEKLIFTINFWSECLRVTYEHAGEQKTRRHVQRIWMACENDWPVFIPHDAWGLRWRAFSLSESAWITPLCAATRDRRLGKGSEWQTPEEIGSGFTINLSCAFVSVFPTSVHSLPTASWFEYKHGLSYLFPRRITTTIMW